MKKKWKSVELIQNLVWISNVLNSLVDKTVIYEIVQIPISEDEDKKVIILNIPEGTSKPYYLIIDNIFHIRKNTSVFPAKSVDIAEMYAATNRKASNTELKIVQYAKGNKIQQIGPFVRLVLQVLPQYGF